MAVDVDHRLVQLVCRKVRLDDINKSLCNRCRGIIHREVEQHWPTHAQRLPVLIWMGVAVKIESILQTVMFYLLLTKGQKKMCLREITWMCDFAIGTHIPCWKEQLGFPRGQKIRPSAARFGRFHWMVMMSASAVPKDLKQRHQVETHMHGYLQGNQGFLEMGQTCFNWCDTLLSKVIPVN